MNTKSKIICGVVALAVAGGGIFWYTNTNKSSSSVTPEEMAYSKTFTLTKGDLESVVDVDGVVVSAVETEVTTENTGKVVKLNVKQGDKVKKGDIICVLDSKDIDRQIKDLQEGKGGSGGGASATAVKKAKAALKKAEDRFKARYSNPSFIENKHETLQKNADQAYKELVNADSSVTSAQDALEKAKTAYEQAGVSVNLDQKISDVADASKAKDDALANRKEARENREYIRNIYGDSSEEYKEADEKCKEAEKAFEDAEKTLKNAETALQNAQNTLSDKQDAIDKAEKALEDAKKSAKYQEAKKAYDNAAGVLKNYEESIYNTYASDKEAVDTAKKELESLYSGGGSDSISSELEKLQEQKDACTLRAESAGEITQLNVKLGSIPKGSIALIQSTDKLIFEVSIPEESINKVSTGLMVSVTAASIDVPVTGKLTQISSTTGVTSTGGEGGGDPSGGAGYKAQITLDQPGGLHIGSKAHGSIILSSKKDVFVVPNEAVGNDEGLTYIRAVQPDGSYKKIPVTVGDSNETMVEISGDDLVEGIEILSDAYYEDLISTEKQKFEEEEQ